MIASDREWELQILPILFEPIDRSKGDHENRGLPSLEFSVSPPHLDQVLPTGQSSQVTKEDQEEGPTQVVSQFHLAAIWQEERKSRCWLPNSEHAFSSTRHA